MYPYYNMYRNEPVQNVAMDEELITFEHALELIRKSIANEREDEMFYEGIIAIAPTMKEKDIIASIRDDERKHHQILVDLYQKFTGNMPMQDLSAMLEAPVTDYKAELEKALFGELEAVKKYRKIMGAMPDAESHTLLMSIMTDEIRHANKYNFLIATAK